MRKRNIDKWKWIFRFLPLIVVLLTCGFDNSSLKSQNITQVEYFFNTDPGYGNATQVTFTPAPDVTNISLSVDVSALSEGFSRLFARSKDESENWSITASQTIYKMSLAPSLVADIVQAEYFVDYDPGFGQGTPITVAPGITFETSLAINVSSLSNGFHRIFVRSKDEFGNWSITASQTFYKMSIPPSLAADIVQLEYFVDNDPGIGQAIALPVPQPGANLNDLSLFIELDVSITVGLHDVFFRTQDADGHWSITFWDQFCRAPIPNFSTNVVAYGTATSFTNLSLLTNGTTQFQWDIDSDGIFDYTGGNNFTHLYSTPGSYQAMLVVTSIDGCTDTIVKEVIVEAFLDLKFYLEGAYNATTLDLRDDLRTGSLLPLNQPYNIAPWNYNGTEHVISIPANVVDWVLVDMRSAPNAASANASTTVRRFAAFLLKDGSVVDVDGSSQFLFNNSLFNALFVVIRHRNHLDILSANALIVNNGVFAYDFTTTSAKAFGGSNAQSQLATSIWGMISGNANSDGIINNPDKTGFWTSETGKRGYLPGDFNMNGQVNNKDKNDHWYKNLGKQRQVPQ